MTILEKRQQIDEAISALKKLQDEASFADTPGIVEAIAKLTIKKELLVMGDWDNFKLQITDDDFARLKAARIAIDDATTAEQDKIEKVNKGIEIGKKILGVLKII